MVVVLIDGSMVSPEECSLSVSWAMSRDLTILLASWSCPHLSLTVEGALVGEWWE